MKFGPLLLYSTLTLMVSTAPAEDTKETTATKSTPPEVQSDSATPPATTSASDPVSAKPAAPAKANPIVAKGKELHETTNCKGCHQPDLYTSPTRKMKTYASLQTQVQTCATNLSIPWFEEEVESVAAYLNTDYYKFETK